ncbi:MAG: TIGR03621 family F420-dependent LLM class oxidoreductase [Acidimicrobiales bacterium]
MRPFRFAVQATGAGSGKQWRARARAVEAMGYSTLFVPDHLDGQWGPLVALTVAAEATESLRVGSLVLDNDYRNPVVLAKELASLDLASDGRLEVGLGAGWRRSDYEESGIAFDDASTRVERLGEALHILRSLLAEGGTTFEGRHYRVREAAGLPRPASRPRPPLLVGGGGRRVLRLAAREADIVGVNPSLAAGAVGPAAVASAAPERFDERLRWIREAAGERFDALELCCLTQTAEVGPGASHRLEALAPAFGLEPAVAREIPLVLAGEAAEVSEGLQERRERYGLSYWVVHDAEADGFAAVVDRLAGR